MTRALAATGMLLSVLLAPAPSNAETYKCFAVSSAYFLNRPITDPYRACVPFVPGGGL